MRPRALDREFFAGRTLEVARNLLGCTLRFGRAEGIIVETEAYTTDGASHFRTRPVKGRPLAETWGSVYVYLNYGMHYLLNFTTEREGVGAVLVRGVEPTAGIPAMIRRRGTTELANLTNGPGKICQAFGINMRQHGEPVGRSVRLYARREEPAIVCGPRVGISRDAHLPWRFYIARNPFVSRSPAAPRTRGAV